VTIDGFGLMIRLIGLFDTYSAWLQFKIHRYTHNSIQSHVFTSRCSVAAFNGWRFPSSGFPNYHCFSASIFSQQLLTTTEPQQISNSATDESTQLHTSLTVLFTTFWHGRHRKHSPLLLYPIVAVKTHFLRNRYLVTVVAYLIILWSLPSNCLHATLQLI
jgi:hypothetical protein